MNGLRSALWLPLFDDLAGPLVGAREPVRQVADPWIALAAIAAVTERIRLGPMVTALPRRRPVKVARESVTLDRLSEGRLTLGVGLGSDRFAGELTRTGEELDARRRGWMLDESSGVLGAAWSGEPVRHRGEHYTVDDIAFLPRPVRRPGVPVWAAGMPGNAKPIRRAARLNGVFPANLEHPDQLAEIVGTVGESGRDMVAAGVRTGRTARHCAGRTPRRPRGMRRCPRVRLRLRARSASRAAAGSPRRPRR
ncbi:MULTISPECIES: LLM class flavin-dependent oxidoreductase [Streptomyces]|uniref:LLM class flavin-dependent oxidoreductase n=1 Tax=Streptomyces TaxID=1883 RepID=UPI001F08E84D|nr:MULTISPECIES: LLM class flavin-dependent oxidoreductase [Streptomyces]